MRTYAEDEWISKRDSLDADVCCRMLTYAEDEWISKRDSLDADDADVC